ncbi:MAG: GlmU family protein, partial [Bacteroidota bacterium]
MNIILFDDPDIRESLLPLTFTRPVGAIRVGILTIQEKWEKSLALPSSFLTQDYLKEKFPLNKSDENLWINGSLCPDKSLLKAIDQLDQGQGLVYNDLLILAKSESAEVGALEDLELKEYEEAITIINTPWSIFKKNAEQIKSDFELVTANRQSAPLEDSHTIIYGKENVFIEEGARIKSAIINAENGPVYIGKNSYVHEGAIIKGSFALCEGSHVNMGAKIKGDSTIGPHSKVGGEVSNSVIFGYSNKGHDGFIGNTVIGEWCNLGADTNTSNLKNDYGNVKLWNYEQGGFKSTGETFCGLIMGDHAKCGINTMFNTGTVVGVSANIFGSGFPRNFVPSFSWGGAAGFTTYQPKKVAQVAE